MNTQHRSNREEGLEQLVEAMRSEDCGKHHASVKRQKKKVDEKHATAKCDHCDGTGNHGDKECKKCGGDGWLDAKDVVKEADNPIGGDEGFQAFYDSLLKMRTEVDEYMTSYAHTTGAEDFKANVLDIITGYLGGASDKRWLKHSMPPSAPAGAAQAVPTSSPARQSQSPLRPSGMSGPGMMP